MCALTVFRRFIAATQVASRGLRQYGSPPPPFGLVENAVYQPHAIELAPGDRLLIVTDGFTEAHDPDNAIYGEGRVETF